MQIEIFRCFRMPPCLEGSGVCSYHCVHKSAPLDPILSQTNPLNITKSFFLKIYVNVILPQRLVRDKVVRGFRLSQRFSWDLLSSGIGIQSLNDWCQMFRDSVVFSFSRVKKSNEELKYEVLDLRPLNMWLPHCLQTSLNNHPVTISPCSLPFIFSTQNIICFYQIFYPCYMPKPSHLYRFEEKH